MGLDDGTLPTVEQLSSTINVLRKENENLANHLHNACAELENRGGIESWNEGLYKWWKNRQREVRQEFNRRQSEAATNRNRLLAEQARAKLTPEERKALGIE